MSVDELPFEPDDTAEHRVVEREPRKCRHPRDQRTPDGEGGWRCRCGHAVPGWKVKVGRNVSRNGKRVERIEMRKAGLHTGTAQKSDDGQSIDGMFAYQSKSRATTLFPGWQSVELDKLRRAHQGKVPVLVVIERPGIGRRPRKLAVVEWTDWLDLHGKSA